MGVDVGHRPDRPVEGPGREPLERRVGGAVRAHPVDHVDPLALGDGQHLADRLGRVLQVGVDGDHPLAPGAGETRRDGGLVPGVRPQPHDAHLRPLAVQPLQQHRGGVGATRRRRRGSRTAHPTPSATGRSRSTSSGSTASSLYMGTTTLRSTGAGVMAPRVVVRARPTARSRRASPPWPRARLRAPEYEIGGPRRPAHADVSSRSVPAAVTAGSATRRWRRPRKGRTSTQAVGRGTHAVARVVATLAGCRRPSRASRREVGAVIRTTCLRDPFRRRGTRSDTGEACGYF